MYGMLQAAGVCLPVGGGSGACGRVRRDECGCIRAQVCIPHAPPYAAARAAGRALSLSARWRLRDPSGEAGPVPDFPILARVGGPPAGMGEDGQVLSGNRQGPADPNQERAGTGRGDAAGASETVPVVACREPDRLPATSFFRIAVPGFVPYRNRSEEHTSELQSL